MWAFWCSVISNLLNECWSCIRKEKYRISSFTIPDWTSHIVVFNFSCHGNRVMITKVVTWEVFSAGERCRTSHIKVHHILWLYCSRIFTIYNTFGKSCKPTYHKSKTFSSNSITPKFLAWKFWSQDIEYCRFLILSKFLIPRSNNFASNFIFPNTLHLSEK